MTRTLASRRAPQVRFYERFRRLDEHDELSLDQGRRPKTSSARACGVGLARCAKCPNIWGKRGSVSPGGATFGFERRHTSSVLRRSPCSSRRRLAYGLLLDRRGVPKTSLKQARPWHGPEQPVFYQVLRRDPRQSGDDMSSLKTVSLRRGMIRSNIPITTSGRRNRNTARQAAAVGRRPWLGGDRRRDRAE